MLCYFVADYVLRSPSPRRHSSLSPRRGRRSRSLSRSRRSRSRYMGPKLLTFLPYNFMCSMSSWYSKRWEDVTFGFCCNRSRDSVNADNPGNNLYVTGLSTRITNSDLEKYFGKEGKVCLFLLNFVNLHLQRWVFTCLLIMINPAMMRANDLNSSWLMIVTRGPWHCTCSLITHEWTKFWITETVCMLKCKNWKKLSSCFKWIWCDSQKKKKNGAWCFGFVIRLWRAIWLQILALENLVVLGLLLWKLLKMQTAALKN